MSFFQGLGNFAGGVAQGASPYIQMMMRDKMEQDKETRDSEKLQGAMSVMNNQVPAYTPQEIGDMQSAGFTPQERPQGVEPMRQSSGGSIMEKKASFIDTIANMSPNEALGAYTAELTKNGVKIDKTSLGVFDMLSKGVAQGKAEVQAEEERTHKIEQETALGTVLQGLVQKTPSLAPFSEILSQLNPRDLAGASSLISSIYGSDATAAAALASYGRKREDQITDYTVKREDKIADREDTQAFQRSLKEDFGGATSQLGLMNLQLRQDQQEYQRRQDEEKKIQLKKDKEIEAKNLSAKRFDTKYTQAKDLVPKELKNAEDIHKWKAYYAATGQVPKKNKDGVYLTDVSRHKSNPTKTAMQAVKIDGNSMTRDQIIKEATKRGIDPNAALKKAGYK